MTRDSGPSSSSVTDRPIRLDPHAPLVLDTRELGRRPGSMRAVQRTVPAPGGLGLVDLIGVPPGADLELDLRLESVVEGVLVSGEVSGPLVGECGRCLEPVSDRLAVQLQELYVYDGKHTDRRDLPADEADDEDEVSHMVGDLLDLEPALRDAVVLALPLTPLCDPDCAGLCAGCGERLDDLPEDHTHEAADPRWGALAGLLPNGETSRTPDRSHNEEQ
jgi:uncharacterized protein